MKTEQTIWQLLEQVCDPEVPVLTIVDLGVVRRVQIISQNHIAIDLTPTYTGCPAMDVIEKDIRKVLLKNDFETIDINTILSPSWTTDWLSEHGKQKLKQYGIAPPIDETADKTTLMGNKTAIQCPKCHSDNTEIISRFGSTACKALHRCKDCLEPFDYFKCLK